MSRITDLACATRPTPRILQFGGGNFLRGFMDWKIDRMNDAGGSDWGVVILRSLGHDRRVSAEPAGLALYRAVTRSG